MTNINWFALIGGILLLTGGTLYLLNGGAAIWGVALVATAAILLVTAFTPRGKKTATRISQPD